GADIEEQEAAQVADDAERKGEGVQQRKAVFQVHERDAAAEELAEVVATQLVQTTHRVDVVAAAAAHGADQTQREERAGGRAAVQPIVERRVHEGAAVEQIGVAAGAERRRPVLIQLEALAVVRAKLLVARRVTAQVPADLRETFAERGELGVEGDRDHAERPVDAAVEISDGRADPVIAVERVGDLGPRPGEAAELAAAERGAAGQRLDDVEVAVVGGEGAPVPAVLQIEVRVVEVREGGDRLEAEEHTVVAERVRHQDLGDVKVGVVVYIADHASGRVIVVDLYLVHNMH